MAVTGSAIRNLGRRAAPPGRFAPATPSPFSQTNGSWGWLRCERLGCGPGCMPEADPSMSCWWWMRHVRDLGAGGGHMGGSIAPGIRMRLQAMHEHTHALSWIQDPVAGWSTCPS